MATVSGFDPVPMFIGDKALHSADTVRAMIDAATGGESGVTRPRDLKVSALGSPTNQVQIGPGTATIQNRSPNGSAQAYTLRAPGTSRVDIPSAAGSYLVVARVEDPQYTPWTAYSTIEQKRVGPYIFPRVIPVSSGVEHEDQLPAPYNTQSMVALARVDMPGGTTQVLPQYVKELRRLTSPWQHTDISRNTPTFEQELLSTDGVVWPDWQPEISVPRRATSCIIEAEAINVGQRLAPSQGVYTVVFGSLRGTNTGWDMDAPVTGGSRHTLKTTASFPDITSIAGTRQRVRMEARRINIEGNNGYLVTIADTQLIFKITFYNKPL